MNFKKYACNDVCIIVPTHNSEDTIEKVLSEALKVTRKIIVVDSSTDNTIGKIKKFRTVRIFRELPGKSNQIRRGLKEALTLNVQYMAFLDDDGEKTAKDVPKMIKKLLEEDADICIGIREKMRSTSRAILNKIARFWINFVTGFKLKDPMSGAIVGKKSALQNLQITTNEYETEVEIILESFAKGFKITECEITTPSIHESGLKPKHVLKINNFFDLWILKKIHKLKIPTWKKIALFFCCFFGLITGSFLLLVVSSAEFFHSYFLNINK
ncbi:MAG: glycosyltransferase family 2 protein [Candidatus Diapherotrites archaeon]